MIGSTCSHVITTALQTPTNAPVASVRRTASRQSTCRSACSHPTRLMHSDMLAAMEMSKTPLISEITSPSVKMPAMAWLAAITRKLSAFANVSGSITLNTINSRTSK